MLYVLHGSDLSIGREKLHTLMEGLRLKRPDASVFRITADALSLPDLRELSLARGLFEAKHIVLLDLPLSSTDARKTTLELLPEFAASENLFVLFEGEIDAKTIAILKKHATKVQVHSSKKEGSTDTFNRFALPDALGKRDRKLVWVLYQKALRSGMVEEEIHGLLFWQIKSMLLAVSGSAESSGLKPFVYSKARLAAAHYSREELLGMSEKLVTLYHDARRGKCEMETALERFVLGV